MSWMDSFDSAALRRDTERALRLPVGLASPLWLAFGAAASAGVAWWWMSRMGRPFNIEAKMAKPRLAAEPVNEPVAQAVVADTVAVAAVAAETAAETVAEVLTAETEAVTAALADDLTTLKGVGPKLAAALKDLGVTAYAQIAAWTAEDLAKMDAALNLRGRAVRDDWVGQAKTLTL
jgi:predicted flap endonuclease-1-like 5' DNA nuclease